MAIPDAFLPATFLDAYVLAADDAGRRAALETQLVPNSPEALYARVVNALNRDAPDFKAAEDALNKLDALVASFKSRNGYENATLVDIARNSRHRVLNAKAGTPEGFKALADFYTSPSLSLARFDHAKPTNPLPSAGSAGSAAMYPASLDQSLIDPFKVMEKTIEEYMGAEGLEPTVGAFAFFARRLEKEPIGPETENKLRQLLDRPVSSLLAYYDPDTGSNLLPSVLSKLWTDYEDSRFDFLSEFIPRLTLNEVDGLAERFPELWAEPEYVGHYLRKLLPETPSVDQFSTSLPVWTEAIPRFCAKISSGPLLGLKLRIDLEYLDRVRKEQGKGEDFVRFEEYLRIPKRSPVGNRTIYDKFKKSKDFRKFGEQDVEARDSWSVLASNFFPPVSDEDEEALVRDYIEAYLLSEHAAGRDISSLQSLKRFADHLDPTWLRNVHALVVLHRTNSPDVFKLSQYLPEPLADLTSRVKLEFHRFKNPVANELRTLHVVAKNTPSIRVNVFRIAALQFYRSRLESNKGIDDDDLCSLDLGGLVPNATRDLDFSHLGPLAIHDVEISLTDELLFPGDPDGAKRGGGLWIVELVGKSKRIRCVIRRGGTLGYMRRLTAGGVVLAIVGGDGRRLRDPEARVWLSGRVYQPDDHGDFALPFSREAEATTVLLIVPSRGLVVPREFDPPQEHYSLEAKFILNREALVHGNKVPVLVRSSIMLDDEKEVGLAVVDDSSLNVTFIDGQGLKTTRTVDGFLKGGYELGADRTFDFIVPPDLRTIVFNLQAKVRVISENRTETLTSSESLDVNRIDETAQLHSTFLQRSPKGDLSVFCLGKTGEPRVGENMFVRFKSRFACKPIDVALSTDEHGAVSLGPCRDVEAIAVYSGVSQPRVWNLDYTLAAPSTRFINAVAGEDLVVHLPRPVKTADIRLVKVAYPDGDAVSYPVGSLKLADDGLAVEISRLEAGCYCLEGADVFIDIRVVASTKDSDLDEWSSGLVLGDKAILARESNVVASETTRVTNVDSKADQISLTLLNASPNTVVEVLLNNFLPFDVDSGAFAQHRESAFHGTTLRADSNSFTSEKDLPEELNYVIARKSKPKGLGNLLRKPGVLLSTWKLRSTSLQSSKLDVPAPASCESSGSSGSSESIMMRKGGVNRYHRYHAAARSGAGGAEAFADEGYMAYNVDMGSAASVAAAPVFSDRMDPITTEDQANYSFLVHPGEVLYSLKPNSDGRVLVTLTSTSTPRTALIIVTDGSQVVVRQVFVPGSAMDSATVAVRDIALKPSWSVDAHVAEHNQISTVVAGDAFSMLGGSTFCVISTLAKLLELGETLCAVDEEKERFVAFRFLANWSSMSNEKKRSLYGEHGCHELNLFIRFKDPGFFDEVVRPFIACKAFKQPIDHFLLGNREQCAEYLANPSAFARLNIAEKLLLGSFVGGDSNSSVERWVLDDLRKKEARPGSSVERARFREQFFKTVMATLGAGERPSEPKDSQTDAMPPPPPSGMAFGAASAAPPIAMAMMAAPAPKAAPPPPPAPVMAGAPSIQAVSRRSGPTHDLALRTAARQQASEGQGIYEPLEATSEWGERQWWKRKDPSPALVENSAFWRDWIGCSDRSSFLSENLDQVLRYTFTEAIVAVSLMAIGFGGASDADYEAKQPADAALTALDLSFTARRPLIVLHKGFQVSETKLLPTLLVGQHFYDPDHRQFFDPESGETVDRYLDLGENLVPLRRYGCQVTLTNTSAVQHLLTVLHQIPEGAIPVANSVPTKSETVSLRPFETLLFDFSFYFPRAGKFQQYPVHVSDRRQMIVAHGEPVTLVVERPQSNVVTEDVKREFWWMASEGTGEELLAWLADERNVIEPGALGSLLWRLKDRKMFVDVVESLRRRKAFDRHVWSYALLHGLPVETKEWMSATSWIISAAMPFGQGPLLAADALELGQIELVEYWPLVNARAFQIGDRPRVNNREAIATLEATTRYLFHKPTFRWSSGDHLHLICLLLAQDRFSEAKNAFETLASLADAGTIELEQRVQYDYARAWMSFLEDPASNSLQVAREIADRYKAYPVPHWNGLFAELGRAVKELDALRHGATSIPLSETEEAVLEETSDTAAAEGAREARQAARCRKEPRLEFQPSDGIDKLSLSHANLQECVVGFHPLDLEVEFSTRPFGGDGGSAEAASNPALFIWPVDSRKIEFAAGEEETTVDLPSTLKNTNLVIDVSAKDGEIVRSKVAGQSSMIIQVLQQSGMFQVFTTDRKPVASAYVKVYARLTDKSVVFYKDGFTDVLGRFDYASLSNTSLLQRTERFAILVADEQLGSAVKQASAPKS